MSITHLWNFDTFPRMTKIYDFIVIGSGFAGSVAAMRLAAAGKSVLVIEAGRRYRTTDFPKSNWNLRKFLFLPSLGLRGIMRMDFFRGLTILSGAGVGGGSLVYANTLITPNPGSFQSTAWPRDVGVEDWYEELKPYYGKAKRMLGVTKSPVHFLGDQELRKTAETLGYGDTFHPVDVGVFFGAAGKTVKDPFFGGEGPERAGCTHCGGCMVGCRYNAKNTLDKNYLYFAEKNGARILADTEVSEITPMDSGYIVIARRPGLIPHRRQLYRARHVVLAAGVLGTLKILWRCKKNGSLSRLSPALGTKVRTNNESILGVRVNRDGIDFSKGLAIGSGVNPNPHTKIEAVRYPKKSNAMALFGIPFRGGRTFTSRTIKTLSSLIRHPIEFYRFVSPRGFSEKSLILLIMQSIDNRMRFCWKRSHFLLHRLRPVFEKGARPPTLIKEGIEFAEAMASRLDGQAGCSYMELLGQSFTAHILGGCPMGAEPQGAVVNRNHEVFHYPGLYILGGAAIPANLGVNPSLTITAMAERAVAKILDQT